MRGLQLTEKVDNIFLERVIYGKMFASRFLPDYREIYILEREKKYLKFYNELIETNRVNGFAKSLMSKNMKEIEDYSRTVRKIDK